MVLYIRAATANALSRSTRRLLSGGSFRRRQAETDTPLQRNEVFNNGKLQFPHGKLPTYITRDYQSEMECKIALKLAWHPETYAIFFFKIFLRKPWYGKKCEKTKK